MSRARVMADLFGRFGMAGGRLSIDSLYASDLTSDIVKAEGDMASNSTVKLATQASIKSYVDAKEGSALKSTGESGGTKFLREDGDGTSSWQPVVTFTTGKSIAMALVFGG